MTDPQADNLFHAQDVVLERHPKLLLPDLDAVVDDIASVISTPWFRERWGRVHVNVYDGRGSKNGRTAASTYGEGEMLVADVLMPRNVRDRISVLDEMAHICHERNPQGDNHGPVFVGIMLALVGHYLGRSITREFKAELRMRGVVWKPYRRRK